MFPSEPKSETGGQGQDPEEVPTPEDAELDRAAVTDTADLIGEIELEALDTPNLGKQDRPTESLAGLGLEETVSVSPDAFPAEPEAEDEASQSEDTTADQGTEPADSATVRRSLMEGMRPADTEAAQETRAFPKRNGAEGTPSADAQVQEVVTEEARAKITLPEEDILIGATVLPTVRSKAGPRWLSAILTLLFVPAAWYLISDAAARLAFAPGNPMETGQVNLAALGELGAGLVFIVFIALLAAQSSLGLLMWGTVLLLIGAVFLAAPAFVSDLFVTYLEGLRTFSDFGANVVGHLALTGYTGMIFVFGFVMIAAGWVIASVRRAGRREETMRVEVAQTNPEGLKARWARKETARQEERASN